MDETKKWRGKNVNQGYQLSRYFVEISPRFTSQARYVSTLKWEIPCSVYNPPSRLPIKCTHCLVKRSRLYLVRWDISYGLKLLSTAQLIVVHSSSPAERAVLKPDHKEFRKNKIIHYYIFNKKPGIFNFNLLVSLINYPSFWNDEIFLICGLKPTAL
jgi:hypothetical protein